MSTSRLPQLRLAQPRLTKLRLGQLGGCASSLESNRRATRRTFVASQSRAVITLLLVWSLVCQTMAPHYARFTTNPALKSVVESASAASGLKSEETNWLSQLAPEFLADFAGLSSEASSSSGPPADTLTDAIISRRAPAINSGRIEGSLRVLQGEAFSVNANASITGDLFLPGSPSIQSNGGAQHAGLINDGGAATPANYTVSLSGGIILPGRIHTHVDAVSLPADFPQSVPTATGLRNVTVRSQSDVAAIGDWQTVRDLNVTKSGVVINVPPGNYGTFTVNGNSRLEFTAGTYNFANTFNLDGGASLQATGAVVINVSQNLTVNSGSVVLGSYTAPADVRINVLGASVNLNGSSQVSGLLRAYNANFIANGKAQLRGQVIANQVTLNGGKVTGAVWPAHSSGQMVIFGPRRFDRTTGSPNQYLEQFALPAAVASPYTLHIQNGEPDGSNRVSSATLKINGAEVLVPSDLNQNIANIDRTVSLNATNTLEMRLASNPGSFLIINIVGPMPVSDTTPPTLSITAPANHFTTTDAVLDLSGTASDTGTAATGVAHVYVNGLEAAFNETESTWTVTGVPLLLGANQITVRAIDGAGNETTTSINITRAAPNDPPVVDAGPDQTFALPHTAALHGTASDDGLPTESSLSISWSVVSHPGSVTFSSVNSLDTNASFSVPGSYVLQLSASDGELLTSDDITITVQPENQPPTVNAGPNQTIALPHTATLNGNATDDGLPADSTMTILWSQISGPGTVTFEAPFQSETIATFSAPGIYVLRLTVNDTDLTATSDVTITVHPENHAPTAHAGADQIIILPNGAALNGSATDDGLPVGSTLTTTWTVVNGPGTVMFANSGVTVTAAAFSQPGTYILRLTASDSEMNANDDVVITVIPENHAPSVNAGADQTITLPGMAMLNGSAADDGLPLGSTMITTWSKLSGPGNVTFASPNTATTSAAFNAGGVYLLRLTASDSEFTAGDDVQINVVDPGVPPSADFVVPQSSGVAGGFVIASSSDLSSADLILDSNSATSWTTNSPTNQFVKIQFFDQQMVFIDRVRLQSRQGFVSNLTLKDFEVQASSTTSDDQSFTTALTATLLNTGQLQEFVFPGGPRRARYLKLIARNNYGGSNITLGTFNPVAVGSADSIISLPGQSNVALCQSPALRSNGGAIYSSSYSGGTNSANNLPGYFVGGWQAGSTSNQFATIQLAGGKSYTLEGIRLATGFDSTLTGVKDFEVWISNTTPDDTSFSRVLAATAELVPYAKQFLFPGGPVQARYVKYVPLNNRGGPTINTQAFDVIAEDTARVVGVSAESGVHVNSAQAAFDGITTTNWIATGTLTNVWVKTALANAATQQIYGVRILPITDASSQQGPKDFDIRVSTTTTDDSAFTTIYSGTMAPIFSSPPQEFVFSNFVDARYVQFVWKNSYHSSLVGVRELEVLSAPDRGSAILAFSSQADTLEGPGNAIDIDPIDQAWVTALNQNTNQWLKLLLPRAELWTINHIALGPGPVGSDLRRSPKDFELQVSTTDFADSSFTTVLAGTLVNSSSLQDFYFPAAQARYVRLLLKNNYGSGQIALSSFYIYSGDVIGTNTRFIDQSSDADGQIASWSWNFGDGSTSTERHPAHTFPAPGDYSVSLTVTDDSGLTSTRQVLYHVASTLQPDFTYSPMISHEGGELVRFTDVTPLLVRSTAFRQYDFGDGSTLTQGANTSLHTFPDNGTFHVRLKIGDPLGVGYTVTKEVTVLNVPPSVDIDPGKTIVWGEQWTSVPRISDQSPIDSQSLHGQWNFGDGHTSQCVNCTNAKGTVTHAYNNPGTYNASLTITDKDGGAASDNATFLVNKRPTALVIQSPPPQTTGAPFVIHAQLRDTFANLPLLGKPVQFTLNGASFNTVTGANGVAEVPVALPAGTKIDIITGSFAEDEYYLSCTGVAVPPTAGSTPQSDVPSHQGTNFWLMFPYAWFDSFGVAVQTLYITSSVATSGTVTIPGLNFTQNFTVQANSVLTIQLPFSQVQENNVVTAKGIHVTSQQPVSVYGLNKRAFTSDAFLGLPVNALGMDYYILAYSNMSFAPSSELGVAAAEDGTIVTITPSVTSSGHTGGVPFDITLNQGQTYLLQNLVPTAQGDLSGSHVTSNKPIAVFAGHGAATIPAVLGCCADHLVEQLHPANTWGKRFATVPIATRTKGDFFRFIAAEDDTAIYLNGSLTATLNRGQFAERVVKGVAEIIATNPIMVAQYSTSISYDSGTTGKADPFMMIIPPYAQFLNHYTITTPATGFSINYANLVVPTASIGSLTMDGSPLPPAGFSTIGVSGFSGAQIPLTIGAHTFDAPVSFGVFVYGYNQDEGYGYPGGMNMIATRRNINVSIAPETLARSINTQVCVVATATDENENPLGGRSLSFTVTGVNPSSSSAQTDAAGQAQLCYVGTNIGTDSVAAAVGDAGGTSSIVWMPPNQAPAVNAGLDQSITLPAAATLSGSANDDGLPVNTLTFTWTKLSGPGNVTFGNASTPATTAIFDSPGVYVLRLSVGDTELSASDEVQITANAAPPNQPPTANAGPDLSATINGNLIFNGGCDQPMVNSEISGWTEVQGTSWTQANSSGFLDAQRGGAYFFAGDEAEAELRQDVEVSAFASSIATGTQQFEFKTYLRSTGETAPDAARVILEYRDATNTNVIATLDSGLITSTTTWHLTEDTRTAPVGTAWIRVRVMATRNTGPTNDAFFDSITLRPVGNSAVKLEGLVTDDGLPFSSTLSAAWTTISGPGVVTFANAHAAATSASFITAGPYVLRITSSDGQLNASDDVTVLINPANQAPIVNAGSNQTITLPASVMMSGVVTDDGQPPGGSVSVIWSKVSGPGMVTFAPENAAATNATFSTPGTYVLRLTADDTEYSASAEVTITVNSAPNNQPPTVSAGADQTISLPADTVSLNGAAADDGLPVGSNLTVAWTTISGPGTVAFGDANNAATTAQLSATGTYVLRLSASDGFYLVTDDITVTLTPPNQAPTANAGSDQTILLSQAADLNGSVSDDGLPFGSTLSTTWSTVSSSGTVTFGNPNVTVTSAQFSANGTYVLRLTASDGQLSAHDEMTVTVNDNVAPPAVEITSPADSSELTEPTVITGSVSNGDWVLEYSLNSEDGAANQVWTQAGSGSGPVTNGSLGTIDTTLMLNGIYSVRLRATDSYGQVSVTSMAVLVDKNFKVGQFQIAFSDLSVPVAGLPIEVIRNYDSRDKRVGDFGVGWQLGLRSARVEKTGVLGLSWFQTVSSGAIPTYCLEPSRPHKVAITFGDGKVFKFRASTAIHCQQLAPITATQLTFTPEPGTHATLESTTATDVVVQVLGSIPGPVQLISQNNPDIFNTGTFRLTTAEGTVYVIDQQAGVRSVRDPYGNTLTVDSSGIIHSSGQSVSFTRDNAGRITQITDPNGNTQTYIYDANGDLTSYTDREQQTTTFTYNSNHHLLFITDARGVELLQNQYDSSGKLIGQTDAFNASLSYDHNVAGRVETITDRMGRQTRYEYDERGNVLRQVDAKGGVKTFTYDAFDNVLTETNALGKTTTYTYDAADNRTSVTDPLGHVTRFTYNGARQPLTVTDARNNVTTNTYDAAGTNLLSTTDAQGKTTSYTYSFFTGLRTTMKDALNNVTAYGYDSVGRLSSETDALGHITTFTYDANGNRTTQAVTRTNAMGQSETITTTSVYDKLNRLTKTISADGSSTLVEYNAIGQQSATIDQLGHRTEFTYDDMGRLTRTNYPDGTHEETTYDVEGRQLMGKDRAGLVTSYTYDELGRLTKTTYPDNTFTSTTYDAVGQVLTSTDARGNVTRCEYDDAGRRTKVRNPLNQEMTFTHDANGNQLSLTDALGQTTSYEYDANNQRTKTTYADGSFDSVGYDALGRSVSKTDQAGKTTQFIYDFLGRLINVKDALNQETTYAYDELGQQRSQTDANNHTARFEYDQLGRRTKRILPLGQVETYAYDLSGNLHSRTDFNGRTTTFTYDVMRRLMSKVPDASLNQPSISFTYNANGQRATMSDASGTTSYTYDARNRLASKQTPFGKLSYTYDDLGNLITTRSSNANGTSVDYAYDALNRLATVKDNNLVTVNGGGTTYSYDSVGNLQSYLYPNGVTTTHNYNSLNRLTSMNASAPIATIASYTYTLGAAGNRTAVSELSGRTVNYTYDDLYRLTNETIASDPHGINGTVSYGYDPVGNRLSRTSSVAGVPSQSSTYDANDRLASDNYDDNGNTRTAGGNNYDYDFENRLTSLITHNSSLITFVYDGDGNRVAKTVGGVTTNYLVDTNNHTGYAQIVEELQGGAVARQFTYGHDLISQRCTLPTANCSLSFYGYDGHGSVRQLTDAAAVVTDTYDYDAFGNLISRTGTTSNDYLYSGEQFDANLGFYYLRARYMNPSHGRFWTMDSFEGGSYDPGSLHKYVYTRNSPSNLIDPSGHFSLVNTVNSSVLIGMTSGFGIGFYSGGIEGAFSGAIHGAIMGAVVPLTGAGVGSFLLGNAARGVFITGWGVGLGSASTSGFSFATATTEEERTGAGISLLASAGFMYFGPKILQSINTRVVSGNQANQDFSALRLGKSERPWPDAQMVSETTVFARAKVVRTYTEGKTDSLGYWVMASSEIEGLTPIQIQQKFALPHTPTHVSMVDIPAGTTIRIGMAGENAFGPGGGMQIEIQRPNFPHPPTPAPRIRSTRPL